MISVHALNDNLEKVEEMKLVIDSMNFSEEVIPQSLRLCNTFFTQMVIVGKCNEINNGIPSHSDEDDLISCIITLGSPNNGNDTDYYDGINNNIFMDKNILVPFKHRQLQIVITKSIIACVHGMAIEWYWNLIWKKIVDHFQLYGMKYYKKYQKEGFSRFFI